MNGSENGYAGALFFSLMSLGALLKLDDVGSWFVGVICAVFAAISLRLAFIKAAQAVEENHQRMEVQFQQLRSKIIETSTATIEAMSSVNDAAELARDNLQTIRVRLAELDNLTQLAESAAEIKTTIASLEENSVALNVILEKDFEQFRTIEEMNKESLQTVLKLLQLIAQLMKNPAYAKDLEKINSSFEKLAVRLEENISSSTDLSKQDLSMLKRIAAKIK